MMIDDYHLIVTVLKLSVQYSLDYIFYFTCKEIYKMRFLTLLVRLKNHNMLKINILILTELWKNYISHSG